MDNYDNWKLDNNDDGLAYYGNVPSYHLEIEQDGYSYMFSLSCIEVENDQVISFEIDALLITNSEDQTRFVTMGKHKKFYGMTMDNLNDNFDELVELFETYLRRE